MDSPAAVFAALGLPAPRSAERVPTGFDATVWRIETGTGPVALRLLRPGASARPEIEAQELARGRGVPVPDLVAHGRYGDRDAVVTSWCPGRPVAELLLGGEGDIPRLGELFGRAHAELHAPDAAGRVLCHLDFQPFNVLTDGTAITGIVDWTNARYDDPRADLATTRVVLALAPVLLPESRAGVAAFTSAWQAGYRAMRLMPDDAELAPFLAAAARAQAAVWQARADAGEVPAAVADAARQLETAW